MHITQALDYYAARHGDSHPLPHYMQVAVVIHALNTHYPTSNQFADIEEGIVVRFFSEWNRKQPREVLDSRKDISGVSEHRFHFETVVAWVSSMLTSGGDLVVRHEDVITSAKKIADYMNSMEHHLARFVAPAHVRAARVRRKAS